MSDVIPLPSADSVDLEVLRPFQADYLELQQVEEKKVLLRMQKLLSGNMNRLQGAFHAIGLEGRCVMPLDDQMVIQLEWAFHDAILDGQTILARIAADPPNLTDKALRALRNRLKGRYSVYRLNNLVPDLGVEFEDMIFGGKFAVLDVPTAEKRKPGDLMATRIFWTGEYWTHSSGRFFVRPELVPLVRQRVAGLVGESGYDDLSSIVRSQVTTAIIKACAEDLAEKDVRELDWGVLNKFKKQTPAGSSRPPRPPAGDRNLATRMQSLQDRYQSRRDGPPGGSDALGPSTPPTGKTRVGRNDRCPCGSGKKYKHCCGSNN